MTDERPSKEQFFEKVGALADEIITAYDAEFAMGVLIVTARAIAESKAAREKPPTKPATSPIK